MRTRISMAAVIAIFCIPALAEVSIVENLRWDHLTVAMRHQCASEAVKCFAEIPKDLKSETAFDVRYSDCCWQIKLCTATPYRIDQYFDEGRLSKRLLEDVDRYCAVDPVVDASTRYESLKEESVEPPEDPEPEDSE